MSPPKNPTTRHHSSSLPPFYPRKRDLNPHTPSYPEIKTPNSSVEKLAHIFNLLKVVPTNPTEDELPILQPGTDLPSIDIHIDLLETRLNFPNVEKPIPQLEYIIPLLVTPEPPTIVLIAYSLTYNMSLDNKLDLLPN